MFVIEIDLAVYVANVRQQWTAIFQWVISFPLVLSSLTEVIGPTTIYNIISSLLPEFGLLLIYSRCESSNEIAAPPYFLGTLLTTVGSIF